MGEVEYHIFCENSLKSPANWSNETNASIQLGTYDLILTNPPFGAKIPVIGTELLSQYELAHYWKLQKGEWIKTNTLREKQPPQILFIERIIQLLKDGGRAGIVLPEGIFGNPSDRYIWQYIKKYASIIGVVSLSQETFQPSTHTKTSVVFLEKNKNSRKSVFFAVAKAIGHNKNGKEIYKIKENGAPVLDSAGNKILDDDTPIIAQNFKAYLNDSLKEENHLGFVMPADEIKENIYIPESYKPEIKEKLIHIKKSNAYTLHKFSDFVADGHIQIKRGNEIGSQYYGSGHIPFVRTTDIVNWELKMDTVKTVSEDVYNKYKRQQDVQENDILFVNDGTFLIGRCSMVTHIDKKCIIQSHLRKIRVMPGSPFDAFYLFYLLNSNFVQEQIEVKTFVQATLSTLGNRIMELDLPVHNNKEEIFRISGEVKDIIVNKARLREKSIKMLNESL